MSAEAQKKERNRQEEKVNECELKKLTFVINFNQLKATYVLITIHFHFHAMGNNFRYMAIQKRNEKGAANWRYGFSRQTPHNNWPICIVLVMYIVDVKCNKSCSPGIKRLLAMTFGEPLLLSFCHDLSKQNIIGTTINVQLELIFSELITVGEVGSSQAGKVLHLNRNSAHTIILICR